MSIINNSYGVGVEGKNLVLKTRGNLFVKVKDKYYEIDFKNQTNKEEDDKKDEVVDEKDIIFIESKDTIKTMEYPGDDMLVVSLDGHFYRSKNKSYTEIIIPVKTTINSTTSNTKITSLERVRVADSLYGDNINLNFKSGVIETNKLIVNDSIIYPNNTSLTCVSLLTGEEDIESAHFVELVMYIPKIKVASGTILKNSSSGIYACILIIGSVTTSLTMEEGEVCIVYLVNDTDIRIVKLN